MKTKLLVAGAASVFVLGAVAQIWAPRLGLTAMLLGVMAASAVIVLRQQLILRRLGTHERLIKQAQKTAANGKTETATYGASILRRVKLLTDDPVVLSTLRGDQPSPAPGHVNTEQSSLVGHGAGRAATPDVSNPFAHETLDSMLTPGRVLKVGGVFFPTQLPGGDHSVWVPGDVSASLERERPELLVIDEQAIHESPRWSSATTAAGTALMRELLEGIRWAKARGIPAYVLPTTLAPDVHSGALRGSSALVLPLDEASMQPAAGGPRTPLLRALHELATKRQGGAS